MTVDASPFFFEASGDCAVLLTHGFTGTPYEVRGVGEALAKAGITARGIRLPGHESADSMITAGRADWRRAVKSAFDELASKYARVGVVGLSAGGLLSLDLASREPRVAAVASLAAPMFLYDWKARYLLPVLAQTPLRGVMKWVKQSPGNIRDREAQARHPSLRWCHIGALDQLRVLVKEVVHDLPRVRAPLFIMHSRADTTAPFRSADILEAAAGSAIKERITLTESYHVITVDVDKARVEAEVVDFMLRRLVHSDVVRRP